MTKEYPVSKFISIFVRDNKEFTLFNNVSGLPVGEQLESGEIVVTNFKSYQAAKARGFELSAFYSKNF